MTQKTAPAQTTNIFAQVYNDSDELRGIATFTGPTAGAHARYGKWLNDCAAHGLTYFVVNENGIESAFDYNNDFVEVRDGALLDRKYL